MSRWGARRRYRKMSRQLRELDRVDMWGTPIRRRGRLRRIVNRREGLLALLITGGTIAAVVVIGPVWKDEVGPLYIGDRPVASAGDLSTMANLPSGPPLPPGVDPVRILPPVVATTTGPHTFLMTSGGQPVAYDPCQLIHYVVNPAGGPAEGEDLIREAVSEISDATGLAFVFDGLTDERAVENRNPTTGTGSDVEWAPVLVAWATEDEHQHLAGDVAGVAGSTSIEMDDTGTARYVSGAVVLDGPDFGDILEEDNGRAIARSIVMHEFGHLVGLDHVDDTDELMYESTSDQVGFGPGGREGLAILGAGRCYST